MFKNIIMKIKEVLYRMNLIKGVKSVADKVDIQVDSGFYDLIDTWKTIYSGYYPKWHDIRYNTIAGPQKRTMKSLNMPKIIASDMAMLVFNERVDISIASKKDPKFEDNIKEVFKNNNFQNEYQRYLEYMFGLGGMVMKPYHDSAEKKIKIGFVTADCFIPISWDADDVKEGVFVHETRKDKFKYTLLEWHLIEKTPGEHKGKFTIKNELFRTDAANTNSDEIGAPVPLADLYENLVPQVWFNPALVTKPSFVYTKPNIANNIDLQSPLGIPLFANSLDVIEALDIAYDSFVREFKLGKKKVIVPTSAIKAIIDPITGHPVRYYDPENEIYEAMNFEMDAAGKQIQDISVELRVDEHVSAINAMLNLLAMQIGLSPGAWSFDANGGIKTATEVVSENSKTFRTKQSHEILVEASIKGLVETIGQTAQLADLFTMPDDVEVRCSFDDSIAEDRTAITTRESTNYSMGLQDQVSALMNIYKITEEEAIEKAKKINDEQKEKIKQSLSPDMIGLQ